MIDGAQQIEALGFHGIWLADALSRGYFTVDPLVALGVIAGATNQVELGTCILQVPLYHPVELARRVLTLTMASGGRLVLGVGAGSTPADFEVVGADFPSRMNRFDKSLTTMRSLWRGDTVGPVSLEPPPELLGGPPLFIGAWGGAWVERAGQEFDGWIGSGGKSGLTRPDGTYPKATWTKVENAVRRFRANGGRRAVLASVVADLDSRGPAGADDPIDLRCPPDEARTRLRRLAHIGFDDVIVVNANPATDHLVAIAALFRR
jgi:alkanesulfonate monooxygenase SsuD/methylene tetrahydromethanopterin reductase-like flavin-dependent oxidoreductase (luciferase family)